MTQAHLPLFFSSLLQKNWLATLKSSDHTVHDTHTEHNYLFLTSHLSPGLKHFPWELDSCYLCRQCHCHTSNRNLVVTFRHLSAPTTHLPPTSSAFTQRKFSQRPINMKWNLACQIPISFLSFQSPVYYDRGTSAADKPRPAEVIWSRVYSLSSSDSQLVNRHPHEVSGNGYRCFTTTGVLGR